MQDVDIRTQYLIYKLYFAFESSRNQVWTEININRTLRGMIIGTPVPVCIIVRM